MKIAITGGNGRVGQAVIKCALSDGHDLVNIDRSQPDLAVRQSGITHIQADITNYKALEAALAGCEALIHLAAIPSPRMHTDDEVHNNNVVGSYNALSAAANIGIQRVCQASSVNAIGSVFSRWPRYDYFPLDELHPTYNEDPYSLSKWICEQQADSISRRYEEMTIASLRLHWAVNSRAEAVKAGVPDTYLVKQLWGYSRLDAVARACLLSLEADIKGHEVFFIVSPDTMSDLPSQALKEKYYPDVPWRVELHGRQGFFNCAKAERSLGWRHDE